MISFLTSNIYLIPCVLILVNLTLNPLAAENVSENPYPPQSAVRHTNYNYKKYSYTSPVGLKALFDLEKALYDSLRKYASESSSVSERLELYLGDYAESTLKIMNKASNEGQGSTQNLSSDPILAFRTIWRFVKYLTPWVQPAVVLSRTQRSEFKDISLLLAEHYSASDGPTLSDIEEAKMALIKLVDTYTMDIQQFAAGNISGKDVGVGLTAAQCIQIGWFAINQRFYATGVEFMEAALDKVEQNGDVSVQLSKARRHVKSAYNLHNEAFEGAGEWDTDFFTKALQTVSARRERTRSRDVLSSSHDSEMYDKNLNQKPRYQNLCKGTYRQVWGSDIIPLVIKLVRWLFVQAEREASKLFCWYEHQVDPLFKIGPLKVEFVAPQTVKFHQLISQTAISELKKNVSKFTEARVSENGVVSKDFTTRLGASTLLNPRQSPTARLIADLAGRATGLQYNEENSKTLHISVYTPGTYLTCHPDHDERHDISVFRIAVFMVYLSDVEHGGGTGFCKRGVVVQPEVGSAILWYNMLTSGEVDVTSDHCSCPVVFGEKWVATAWISMVPQTHLKCDADRSKKLDYLVNKKSV